MGDENVVEYGLDGEPITSDIAVGVAPLEAPAVEPEAVEFPHPEQEALERVVVAAEWLTDLRYTVKKQGVSQADIRTVGEIRTAMEALGVEFDATPALEAYSPLCFTSERSGVNLQVATESISHTLIGVIKGMLRKLMDYINKLVRWFRRAFYNEAQLKRQLKTYVGVVRELRVRNAEFEAKFGANPQFAAKIPQYTEETLYPNGQLPLLTLGLLGEPKAQREVQKSVELIEQLHHTPLVLARALQKVILDGASAVSVQTDELPKSRLENLKVMFGVLKVPVENPKVAVGVVPLEGRLSPLLTELTPYIHVLDVYEELNDILKRFTRFDQVAEWEGLTEMIANLSLGSEYLSGMFQYLHELNGRKIQLLQQLYKYENLRWTLNLAYGREKLAGDAKAKVMDSFVTAVEKTVKAAFQ